VRLGSPEDFAANRLTRVLSRFARSRPGLRLDVRCDLSIKLRSDLERGELDVALMKRDVGETGGVAAWPESLTWVTSRAHPIDPRRNPVPLAVFSQGCLYRARAIHALEAAGRAWHIAYTSPNFASIQAAVSAGLGVSILPEATLLADHRKLRARDGFPSVSNTELALVVAPTASPATRRLADLLADFCSSAGPRGAAT
jgi:DNA-binding transcriptional LysR family regulator